MDIFQSDLFGIYMDGEMYPMYMVDPSNYLRFDGGSVDIRTDEIFNPNPEPINLNYPDARPQHTYIYEANFNTSPGTNKGIFMNGEGDYIERKLK